MLVGWLVLFILTGLHSLAHAETPEFTLDFHSIGTILLTSVLPALWIPVAPIVTAFLTATINTLSGKYVPRSVQTILIAILAAVSAGLTGLGDPFAAGSTAAAAQVVAATPPAAVLADPPKS